MYHHEQSNFMEARIAPELRIQIEAVVADLMQSSEDFITIVGADNKILVKAESQTGKKMLSEERVLFPYSDGKNNQFFVCIATER
jgi:hypothetical protein